MSVGDLMGLSGGRQSSVGVYLSRYVGSFGVSLQSLLIISLCGLPLLGVFFRKHGLFLELVYLFGFGYLLLLMFGFFLSYSYSFRFILLLLKGLGGLRFGYSRSFILVAFVRFLGTLIKLLGSCVLDESLGMSVF